MEAVGGLAAPKNAPIVVVASCCFIKLISYLAYFTSSGFLSFHPAEETLIYLEYRLLSFLSRHNKISFGSLMTWQTPPPRVLIKKISW